MEQKDCMSFYCKLWSWVVAEEGRWGACSFNSKLGQIEKLKNSPQEWPIILLHFLVLDWCNGMVQHGIWNLWRGVAKDGRSGTDIFNLIVVQIKIAKLTFWLADLPARLLYLLFLDYAVLGHSMWPGVCNSWRVGVAEDDWSGTAVSH